jgi:hypothetical protein
LYRKRGFKCLVIQCWWMEFNWGVLMSIWTLKNIYIFLTVNSKIFYYKVSERKYTAEFYTVIYYYENSCFQESLWISEIKQHTVCINPNVQNLGL